MVYMPAAGREYILPGYMAGRPVIAAGREYKLSQSMAGRPAIGPGYV